jgi:hypothetical protein
VLHAFPAQGNEQDVVTAGGQLPAPSQFAALTWRLLEQLWPRHGFVGKKHPITFVPSQ